MYNKTLDTHKSGVQFTLQGFETADKMSRRIVLSLMASGDAIDLPLEQLEAVMYVTTPGIDETSINSCTISDNTIIYDSLPITEEGTTIMQLKLIDSRQSGPVAVLAAPKFAVEVIKSDAEDDSIQGTATYTAVEEALARATEVYDKRLLRIALHSDCMFYAYYADGTIYESDVLKELFLKGDALISQSYAVGGTGVRDGEETDNSKYYASVSKSMSIETKQAGEDALAILDEVKKHGVYTVFDANFETGELVYESPKYEFEVDQETGELLIHGKAYTIDETMVYVVTEWLKNEHGVTFPEFKNAVDSNTNDISSLKAMTTGMSGEIDNNSVSIEALTGEELWSNPSTSDYVSEERTIALDLSEYVRFRVVWSVYGGGGTLYETEASTKDKAYIFEWNSATNNASRKYSISNTGITFKKPDTYASVVLQPMKLIGYKL